MTRKRSKFFYSIFLSVAGIGAILVLGLSIWAYRSTAQTIYRNKFEEQTNETVFVKNQTEQLVKTIEYSLTAYSASESFNQVIDLSLTQKDFAKVRSVSSELAYLESIGGANLNYRLVSLANAWKIGSDNSLNQLAESELQTYQEMLATQTSYLFWYPEKGDIQMLVSLPVFAPKRNALAVATLQKSYLNGLIEDQEDLTIYAKNNQKILYERGQTIDQSLIDQAVNQSGLSGVLPMGKDYIVYARSNYNDWIYLTRLPRVALNQDLRPVQLGFLLLVTLMLAFIFGASYVVANYSLKPIREIRSRISPQAGERRPLEIEEVYFGIDEIMNQNGILNATLQTQKQAMETLFILDLFRRQIAPDEIPVKLAQFAYPQYDPGYYLTAVLTIDDFGDHTVEEKEILLLTMAKFVEDVVPAQVRLNPVVIDTNTQATIFAFPADQGEDNRMLEVLDYFNQVQTSVRDFLKIEISVGLSEGYHDLSSSYRALKQAQEALHFRLNIGTGAIISYRDMVSQLDEHTMVSYAQTDRLLEAIRTGNRDEVERIFPTMMQQIFAENQTPVSIEMAIFQMVNEIIQLGQLLGANSPLFTESASFYRLLNMDNLPAVQKHIAEKLIQPIIDRIQYRTNQEMHSLSEKMVHLVHQFYDQDLSLEFVAEELHYNPNYLSSVFKKEQGINFGDYVLNYRLSIAKKWLKETTMTVKEIGERLQYNNTQNFIRFFKKKEGLTPGEYRKNGA